MQPNPRDIVHAVMIMTCHSKAWLPVVYYYSLLFSASSQPALLGPQSAQASELAWLCSVLKCYGQEGSQWLNATSSAGLWLMCRARSAVPMAALPRPTWPDHSFHETCICWDVKRSAICITRSFLLLVVAFFVREFSRPKLRDNNDLV